MGRVWQRWAWRDRLVLAATALVMVAGWLPWFGRSVAEGDASGTRTLHFTASAWTASTRWAVAVLLAFLAGAVWLLARVVGRAERAAGLVALAVTVVAGWLTVRRWQAIPGPGTGHYKIIISSGAAASEPPDPRGVYAIARDQLSIAHLPGYASDVRYGLYFGLFAMGVLAITLLAALTAWSAQKDAAPDE